MTIVAPFPWLGSIEVRPDGTIWRVKSQGCICDPRRVDTPDQSKGYHNVVLPNEHGRWQTYKAHRLVWWWHYGPIPDGMQINHKNLIKSDNRIENLEVVTPHQNIAHSYANGRSRPWSRSTEWRGRKLIDEACARSMQEKRNAGWLLREIAESEGVSVSHAHRMIRRVVE